MWDIDGAKFSVVVNSEEQYSIWPEGKQIPAGWTPTGFSGDKRACLDQIEQVWTDMRPASLRRLMAQAGSTTSP
jgi:MbtH protein